ncbi:MAG: thermonuclease family protein, partial [Acidimicrobiales bacterium]
MFRRPLAHLLVLACVVAAGCADGRAGTTDAEPGAAEVIRVVDGDTIEVRIAGEAERVRLIGIDTPETVDPRSPVDCFGPEASEAA